MVTGDTFLAMMENMLAITVLQLNGAPPHFFCCVQAFLTGGFLNIR
jgi:hypothetical protein